MKTNNRATDLERDIDIERRIKVSVYSVLALLLETFVVPFIRNIVQMFS